MNLAAHGEANDTELVTTRTGGAKKVQDKARGSQAPLHAGNTAPQSGSVLFHRWSEFLLFVVASGRYQEIQRENRSVLPFHKMVVAGGFQRFYGDQCGGHFLPPGVKSGVCFSSAPTAAVFLAGPGGDIYKFQEDHHARRKTSLRANLP